MLLLTLYLIQAATATVSTSLQQCKTLPTVSRTGCCTFFITLFSLQLLHAMPVHLLWDCCLQLLAQRQYATYSIFLWGCIKWNVFLHFLGLCFIVLFLCPFFLQSGKRVSKCWWLWWWRVEVFFTVVTKRGVAVTKETCRSDNVISAYELHDGTTGISCIKQNN